MTEPRLYLITPLIEDADAFRPALEEACAAEAVVAVLLRFAWADERTLVKRVKALAPTVEHHAAAAIVGDPGGEVDLVAIAVRGGADGAHSTNPDRLQDLCHRLKDSRNVGAGGLLTKHDAMVAGEMGVDYVMFGEPDPKGRAMSLDLLEERAEWWAEIFQTPCVVVSPDLASLPRLVATGADFIALGDPVWTHPDGPRAAVAAALEAMRAVPETAA